MSTSEKYGVSYLAVTGPALAVLMSGSSLHVENLTNGAIDVLCTPRDQGPARTTQHDPATSETAHAVITLRGGMEIQLSGSEAWVARILEYLQKEETFQQLQIRNVLTLHLPDQSNEIDWHGDQTAKAMS